MKDYIYILKLENEEEFVTKTLSLLYSKIVYYCNQNNIDTSNLTLLILQNILSNKTKNKYDYIKELKRVKRYDYVKDELLLRYPDFNTKPTRRLNCINKILNRRGIK